MSKKQTQRNPSGRFVRGTSPGPGRPKGSQDHSTINGKRIKAEFLKSWDEVDGPALLRQLAADNPQAYLSLMLKVIGKELASHVHSDYVETEMELDEKRKFNSILVQERLQEVGSTLQTFQLSGLQVEVDGLVRGWATDVLEAEMAGFHPDLPFEDRLERFRRLTDAQRSKLARERMKAEKAREQPQELTMEQRIEQLLGPTEDASMPEPATAHCRHPARGQHSESRRL